MKRVVLPPSMKHHKEVHLWRAAVAPWSSACQQWEHTTLWQHVWLPSMPPWEGRVQHYCPSLLYWMGVRMGQARIQGQVQGQWMALTWDRLLLLMGQSKCHGSRVVVLMTGLTQLGLQVVLAQQRC